MRAASLVVVALSMFGCATTDARHWAATTLTCEERDVTLTLKEPGVWEAAGCGGAAICTLPPVPGAEPQCYRAGTLHKEVIQSVIDEHANEIRYCYERERSKSPSLAGTVAVKFIITPSGAVRSSEVARSIGNSPALDECVANQVRTWAFPKPRGNGSLIVTHSFGFKPSDSPPAMVCDHASASAESRHGSLDEKLIRQFIGKRMDEIRYCHSQEAMAAPGLAGTVAVKFIISPSGAVCAAEISHSTVANAALELCIAARMRGWRFPAPNGGGAVTFTHRFTFEPIARAAVDETWSPHAPPPAQPPEPSRSLQGIHRSPRR